MPVKVRSPVVRHSVRPHRTGCSGSGKELVKNATRKTALRPGLGWPNGSCRLRPLIERRRPGILGVICGGLPIRRLGRSVTVTWTFVRKGREARQAVHRRHVACTITNGHRWRRAFPPSSQCPPNVCQSPCPACCCRRGWISPAYRGRSACPRQAK